MINSPGRKPTKLESILLNNILRTHLSLQKNQWTIVHHISEDTSTRLQIEIELNSFDVWKSKTNIEFKRIVL